jgi:hypothetical protein
MEYSTVLTPLKDRLHWRFCSCFLARDRATVIHAVQFRGAITQIHLQIDAIVRLKNAPVETAP